jgi:DNA-binding transcriptional MerR regulator
MPTEAQWTIDELAQLVGEALGVDYAGQTNGRVREVPDRRTIRWYTTIGLLDRPAAMRGRTALYGRRHLLQLVAVKRLQADGRTIAEVQESLLGADDATLDGLAHLPDIPLTPPPITAPQPATPPTRLAQPESPSAQAAASRATQSAKPPTQSAQPRAAQPESPSAQVAAPSAQPAAPSNQPAASCAGQSAQPAAPSTQPAAPSARTAGSRGAQPARFWAARPAPPTPSASLVPGVRLADGVTLVLDGAPRSLDAADLAAIAAAATALLDVLHNRGLAGEPAAETEGGPA